MKYEVIGWVSDYDDFDCPVHRVITAPVTEAIVAEIRKHGYLFGGDAHERYQPVLNDGTRVSYSWRGWGGVMARAHDQKGKYSYMFGYMDQLLNPEMRKYPEREDIDEDRIVPRETLAETFVMHLNDDMFDAVKAGTKIVEVRLFDEKRKKIDIGDYIEFRRASNEDDRIKKRVADLFVESSFRAIFTSETFKGNGDWGRRFTPEQFGCRRGRKSIKAYVEDMHLIYDKAQERKHGVIGFVLDTPHACTVEFTAHTNTIECMHMRDELLENPELSDEERKRIETESWDHSYAAETLEAISKGFSHYRNGEIRCGYNEKYNHDVNVMIRKTLNDLFGKEEKLKEAADRHCLYMTLDIHASIVKDCGEPNPLLSLDPDIIEFLHKSGTVLNFDYIVV